MAIDGIAFFAYSWGSKGLTFVLNQLLYRYVSPAMLGLATVRGELFLNLLLQIAREGVRVTFLRQSSSKTLSPAWRNATYLPWVITVFLMPALSILFYVTGEQVFRDTLPLYILAALIELSIEPIALRWLYHRKATARLSIEGAALFVKTAALFAMALYYRPEPPFSIWGWSQVAYALVLAGGYLWHNESAPWPTLYRFLSLIHFILLSGLTLYMIEPSASLGRCAICLQRSSCKARSS